MGNWNLIVLVIQWPKPLNTKLVIVTNQRQYSHVKIEPNKRRTTVIEPEEGDDDVESSRDGAVVVVGDAVGVTLGKFVGDALGASEGDELGTSEGDELVVELGDSDSPMPQGSSKVNR
jgi:hypothetical protein